MSPTVRPEGRDIPTFSGIRTFMKVPYTTVLDGVDVAICGFPLDASATYRTGCRFGPESVRSVSVMCRRYNPYQKIDIFDALTIIDYGDLPIATGYVLQSFERAEAELGKIVQAGVTPIIIGGDHSITLANLRAIAKVHGPVALVHFDSHTDTWDEFYGTKIHHGSPFRRAVEEGLIDPKRSIQMGMRGCLGNAADWDQSWEMGFDMIPAHEMKKMGLEAVIERARERVGGSKAFLTFDIDFLDPSVAPGTGTPEVAGFNTAEALELVRGLKGVDFVAYDMVEVLPASDVGDITSLAAANIITDFLALIALNKQRNAAG